MPIIVSLKWFEEEVDGMIHPPSHADKVWRTCLLLLCALVTLTGCGVQFFYNNLDAFVESAIEDYIDLTPAQEAFFERELEVLWRWHRREELPRYAHDLEDFSMTLAQGVKPADLDQTFETAEGWWRRIEREGRPVVKRLLKSLDDAQINQIPEKFAKENTRWEKRAARRSHEDRQDRWRKNFKRIIERFTGALNREQQALLTEGASEYRPENASWGEYRLRWQAEFLTLLKARHDDTFDDQFETVFGPQQRLYSQGLIDGQVHNQALTKRLLLEVLTSLSAQQITRLQKRLADYAEDLRELSQS